MDLGQIVQHVHQLPLTVDLFLPPQAEPLDADGIVDMAKDRFDDPQAHAVNMATDGWNLL
jgi:hypothetical protein